MTEIALSTFAILGLTAFSTETSKTVESCAAGRSFRGTNTDNYPYGFAINTPRTFGVTVALRF